MNTSIHHRNRRRRRQGAVLVEGVIALSTIAILFAGVSFFHNLHARKSETLRNARYQAWTATRPECPGSTHGQDQREVVIPVRIRSAGMAAPTETVRSSMNMGCNEQPFPNDDVFVILEKVTSRSTTSLLEPAIDTIRGLFRFGR